jgi:hypothetical protein
MWKWAELEARLRQQAAQRLQQVKPCRGLQALRAEYEAMSEAGSPGSGLGSTSAPGGDVEAAPTADIAAELQRMAIDAAQPGWDGAGTEGTQLVPGTFRFRLLGGLSQLLYAGQARQQQQSAFASCSCCIARRTSCSTCTAPASLVLAACAATTCSAHGL